MGQCVLRDLGFEFEKDPEKRKVLDDYLREKIKAKYPKAQSAVRLDEDYEDNAAPHIAESVREPEREREKSPRYSRATSSRVTTQVEKCCQTELESDDSFSKSKSKFGFSSRAGSKLITQPSHENITPKNEILKEYRSNKPNYVSSGAGNDYVTEDKHTHSTAKHVASTPSTKHKSDNPLVESKATSKRSLFASKENIFDGIEHIDFNSPMANNIPTQANRSRIKGFQNNYFRPTRGRSPSPMTEDANIFDDDEDAGYDDEH